MTLRDKIARALYENHRFAVRRNKAPWERTDEIEKDAWRADADIVMEVLRENRHERISNMPSQKPILPDIYGDQ